MRGASAGRDSQPGRQRATATVAGIEAFDSTPRPYDGLVDGSAHARGHARRPHGGIGDQGVSANSPQSGSPAGTAAISSGPSLIAPTTSRCDRRRSPSADSRRRAGSAGRPRSARTGAAASKAPTRRSGSSYSTRMRASARSRSTIAASGACTSSRSSSSTSAPARSAGAPVAAPRPDVPRKSA